VELFLGEKFKKKKENRNEKGKVKGEKIFIIWTRILQNVGDNLNSESKHFKI